jgi:hypothetical protein
MQILVIYFCGISGRYNLDSAFLHTFFRRLPNEAKVKGRWYEKVEKCFRTDLGSTLGSFPTENDALAFAKKKFKVPAQQYEMIIRTQETSWVERSNHGKG